uniref:p7 n=1 Tax=Emaravirus rosae TaxID=1980433 RepID=A0A6M4NKP8_9VIRU|nr:p7 [Emaravirus rosae]QJR96932.1 p7 [Emaravirus rosae]
MDSIIPYTRSDSEVIDFSNYEKLGKLNNLGAFYGTIYSNIKTMFNADVSTEKKFFYGSHNKIPKHSSICYLEINHKKIPNTVASVFNKTQVEVETLPEDVYLALQSILYNYVIENFNNLDTLSAVIMHHKLVRRYFIMIKIVDKQWMIDEVKRNWANILSSTYLSQREVILSHYTSMTAFYYKIVKNSDTEKSVYSFLDDNKHLLNHVLPSLDVDFKLYNAQIIKYVKSHLQICKDKSDYNLAFDYTTISESDSIYGEKFPADVLAAIHIDVTAKLREVKVNRSEEDVLKKPIIDCVDDVVVLNKVTFWKHTDETVSYKPGDDEIEDTFYYGIPDTIETVIDHLEDALEKNIHDVDDINNIDYIPQFPFKNSFKREIFTALKVRNDTVKVSHLTLHYICLFLYISKVASLKIDTGCYTAHSAVLERARLFAKTNVSYLRNRLLFLNQNRKQFKNECVQISLKFNM